MKHNCNKGTGPKPDSQTDAVDVFRAVLQKGQKPHWRAKDERMKRKDR